MVIWREVNSSEGRVFYDVQHPMTVVSARSLNYVVQWVFRSIEPVNTQACRIHLLNFVQGFFFFFLKLAT